MADAAVAAGSKGVRGVTETTLAVSPLVIGRPLAAPWRRLAAMAVDLALVSALSLLSGPWLGIATGAMLTVLLGNAATAPAALKVARVALRGLGAVIAGLSILALGHSDLVREDGLKLSALEAKESAALRETVYVAPTATPAELRTAVDQLEKQVETLKAEQRAQAAAQRSWVTQAQSFARSLGVTFGWSGVYFTLLAGLLGGRTPGKWLLGIRAVKTNGLPFTFFDAFIRHGGYVAGVAMGMIGFLKLLWDPNRQAVEDRIAGTVVLGERGS